ncbi:g12640 [Coccomyxa viridis]|uniref:NADH dehydrogenase [ubiquinone] 1 alpha subcomplex subunit 13 n=1 Tax=Coccomyxa viridis TaxID=1274662 RepID=A0ABP1GAV7_9CHLO
MTETLRRGYPGMKSVKDMPVVQDGPPPGGFPSIRYARRLPSTGPTGFTLFAVATAVMAFGFYRVGEHNKKGRVLKAEKLTARTTIYPILQAEEDRRYVQAKLKALENEAKIMKDVPNWKVGEPVYLTKRWIPPAQPVGAWGE